MQKASNTQTEKINPPSGRSGANFPAYLYIVDSTSQYSFGAHPS